MQRTRKLETAVAIKGWSGFRAWTKTSTRGEQLKLDSVRTGQLAKYSAGNVDLDQATAGAHRKYGTATEFKQQRKREPKEKNNSRQLCSRGTRLDLAGGHRARKSGRGNGEHETKNQQRNPTGDGNQAWGPRDPSTTQELTQENCLYPAKHERKNKQTARNRCNTVFFFQLRSTQVLHLTHGGHRHLFLIWLEIKMCCWLTSTLEKYKIKLGSGEEPQPSRSYI
jgi:hypothetical protein